MIKIEIELENAKDNIKNNLTHAMGDVSIQLRGDSKVIAHELGIALYEIFMENPNVVSNAVDYASRRIHKDIYKEEE